MLFSFVVKNYTNCFVTQNVNSRYYSSVKVWLLEGAEKCSELP